MNKLLIFCVLALLLVHYSAAQKFVSRTGSDKICHANTMYHIEYDTVGYNDDSFINLDDVLGLNDVWCDIDHTRLLLLFGDPLSLEEFYNGVIAVETFLTSFGNFSDCNGTLPDGSLVLRRVISMEKTDIMGIEILAVPARYDEIFQDANVSVSTDGSCNSNGGFDKQICIGANVDDSCDSAKKSIPLYSDKYLDISCSDCFFGFHTDVFLEMHISWFKLKKLAGGFRNITLDAAQVYDAKASAQWSVGVDKTLDLVHPTTVVSFHIGPVPLRIWFEVPVEVKASASFEGSAEASVGAKQEWDIGELSIGWDPKNHWQVTTPKPVFRFTPVISGSAQFNGQAQASLVPTLAMHIDNVLSYSITADPQLFLDVQGSTADKQICAEVDYEVALTEKAELHINIPWRIP